MCCNILFLGVAYLKSARRNKEDLQMSTDNKNENSADTAAEGSIKNENRVLRVFASRRSVRAATATTALTALGGAAEMKTSQMQADFFHKVMKGETNTVYVDAKLSPPQGPYDKRLGYAHAQMLGEVVSGNGFPLKFEEIAWPKHEILGIELDPIYDEKWQAGLRIVDNSNGTVHESVYPQQGYADFKSIPPLIVNSLAFVENREILEEHPRTWNPVIEYERFASALLGRGIKAVGHLPRRSRNSAIRPGASRRISKKK
jgi:hypothetical protein